MGLVDGLKSLGKVLVGKGLPLLGSVVAGGAGKKVGQSIANMVGLGPDASEDEIISMLEANPELYVELQKFEMEHKVDLERIQLQETQAYLADVQNARQRQIEHERATGKSDVNLYVLTWVLVVGFFTMLGICLINGVPKDSSGVLYMLMATLANTGFVAVIAYWFGSSKGSKDKTTMLTMAPGGKKE